MSSKYVVVKEFISEIDAVIAKGVLEENGIRSTILKDDVGGMGPNLQLTEGVRLSVPFEQLETAEELLKTELEDALQAVPERTVLPHWICDNCGEESEAQFTACWNCGQTRVPASESSQ